MVYEEIWGNGMMIWESDIEKSLTEVIKGTEVRRKYKQMILG